MEHIFLQVSGKWPGMSCRVSSGLPLGLRHRKRMVVEEMDEIVHFQMLKTVNRHLRFLRRVPCQKDEN